MTAVLSMKVCTKCEVEQEIDQFKLDSRYADGYHGWCRTCRNTSARRSHHKRRDANLVRMAGYRARNCVDLNRKKRAKNDPAYNTRKSREWNEKNPDRRRALNSAGGARYRARLRKQFVEDVDPHIVWQRDEGVCGICGTAANPDDWHLDHVVPVSRGGEHSYANTQVSHPSCNKRKKDKLPEELEAQNH